MSAFRNCRCNLQHAEERASTPAAEWDTKPPHMAPGPLSHLRGPLQRLGECVSRLTGREGAPGQPLPPPEGCSEAGAAPHAEEGWLGWSHFGDLFFQKFPPRGPTHMCRAHVRRGVRHASPATCPKISDKSRDADWGNLAVGGAPSPSPPLHPPTPLIIFLGCCELSLPGTTGDVSG